MFLIKYLFQWIFDFPLQPWKTSKGISSKTTYNYQNQIIFLKVRFRMQLGGKIFQVFVAFFSGTTHLYGNWFVEWTIWNAVLLYNLFNPFISWKSCVLYYATFSTSVPCVLFDFLGNKNYSTIVSSFYHSNATFYISRYQKLYFLVD